MMIEKATTDDIPDLCELLAILFEQELEFKVNTTAQAKALSMIINNPDLGMILIARKQHQIIGMVNMLFTISTALGERVAILEDMIVTPKHRGLGVGSSLLTEAIHIAREQHCKRLSLLTDSNNLSAHQFYKKHGFSQSQMLTFRMLL